MHKLQVTFLNLSWKLNYLVANAGLILNFRLRRIYCLQRKDSSLAFSILDDQWFRFFKTRRKFTSSFVTSISYTLYRLTQAERDFPRSKEGDGEVEAEEKDGLVRPYRKRWVSTGRNIHALVKLNTSEKVPREDRLAAI